jgi:hypothetical protein
VKYYIIRNKKTGVILSRTNSDSTSSGAPQLYRSRGYAEGAVHRRIEVRSTQEWEVVAVTLEDA